MDMPPGFVAIPLKGAVLVIPERFYMAGNKRGKWWTRSQAEAKGEAEALTLKTSRAPGRGPTLMCACALAQGFRGRRRRTQGWDGRRLWRSLAWQVPPANKNGVRHRLVHVFVWGTKGRGYAGRSDSKG